MSFDKNRIVFHSRMMRVASSLSASVEEGGEVFRDLVYEAYRAAGSPVDIDAWLKAHLEEEFACVEVRPVWIEHEPAWPFFNGRPMVFVTQYRLPKNRVTETRMGVDQTVYLFGARVPSDGGFEVEYRVVTQFEWEP